MNRKLGLLGIYFLIVNTIWFIILTFKHLYLWIIQGQSDAFQNYFVTLYMNHIEPILQGGFLVILWISAIITKHIPWQETGNYLWTYKITWVGVVVIFVLLIIKIIDNREDSFLD